jgi:hypothetical protein
MAPETAQQLLARQPLDTPLPLLGRTPRELLCAAVGVWILINELYSPATGKHLFYLNMTLAVVFTAAFALRFFLARILAVTAAFSAGAQWWIGRQESWAAPFDQSWHAYACFVVVAVLASPDLVRRFDRGTVPRWWPNPWAALGRTDLALVRWSLYSLYMVTALLHQAVGRTTGTPLAAHREWIEPFTIAVGLVSVCLALGRRGALVALPALQAWALYHLLPRPAPSGVTLLAPPALLEGHAFVARPALMIATAGLLLSTWIAARFLRGRLD